MIPDQKLSHTPEFEIPPVPEAVSAPGSPHQTETRHDVMAPTEDTGSFEEKPVVAPTEEPAKEAKPRKAVRKDSLEKQVRRSRRIFDQSHGDGSFSASAGYFLKNDGHQEGSSSKRQHK
ncbi:hypothetical protein PGTUg99_029111 [Puccinia graminis f. sp. tritici]|uniref:Uncharacterized protein n=2 Tax=Puccinia graminis f. sp. tritici TaxID=56615 RepID=E3JWT8_PUCGT|nr:uncharacterized protein PGTG_02954 [Puccinia graminis f. sp. tritici CRL 75-36-700-3]EFP76513.1 hypothetical protein PGTG_02954 [Puccinia graminis f. sp. tritici CRL 75-36-700-3]KAA1082240.1 hypothetical protein PGTUg99_029111 [Puccinia graminis f. sp. tritici]